jgi:small subunit ribosomal protein S19e
MTSVFDVPASELVTRLKDELKKVEQIKPPEWSKFVKTGISRKKPPEQDDFWYWRAASILRQLYVRGKPIGTQRLRVKYGGKDDTGSKPKHFSRAGGSVIRKILQQLETAGLVKKSTESKKGRLLTPKGKSFLDKEAANLARAKKQG